MVSIDHKIEHASRIRANLQTQHVVLSKQADPYNGSTTAASVIIVFSNVE